MLLCRKHFFRFLNSPRCLMKLRNHCVQWCLPFFLFAGITMTTMITALKYPLNENIHLLTTGRFIKYLLVSLRKWLLSGRICTASRFDMLCIQRCCSARLFRNYLSCSCLLISLPPLCSFSTGLFLGSSWVNERDERWLSIKSLFVKHSGCRPAIATVPQSH